jgi:hypothetical protein
MRHFELSYRLQGFLSPLKSSNLFISPVFVNQAVIFHPPVRKGIWNFRKPPIRCAKTCIPLKNSFYHPQSPGNSLIQDAIFIDAELKRDDSLSKMKLHITKALQ